MSATVLCVQEDRNTAGQYANALNTRGYDALPVHDPGQTMEILKQKPADFVLLDVSLSRQDGFEILAQLRTLPSPAPLPVLMVCSGDVTADLEERARTLGAVGVAPASIGSDQLLSRVAEFVQPNGSSVVHGPGLPHSGSLREFPFPEMMHEVHRLGFSGVLFVEHGRKRKAIEFRRGWPVCVKSNLLSECLGGYLVKSGRCSQGQVDESFARMKTGQGLQGEIFVAMDVLDEDGVVAALEDHALEKLFEIFSWRDGRFTLRPGGEVQRGSSIALRGHPSNLIVEGVRRQMPLKWIDRYFERHSEDFLVPAEGASGTFQAVDLDPEEARWFAGLDGNLRLAELEKTTESLRRLVFGLVSVELLRVQRSPGSAEGAALTMRSHEVIRQRGPMALESEETLRETLARMANRMQGQDHYSVLELAEPTTDEEVEASYRRLAEQAHPDLFVGARSSVRQLASQVFVRVEEAFEALRNEESRADYESLRHQGNRLAEVEEEGRRALRAEMEFQKGERLLKQRDYESALVCFGRAMENFPAAGEYRSHYGWCLYLCHQDNSMMLGEALEHCREGLKLAKDREKSYLLLGRLYKVMGKAGAAKKMFTRAVQIKPQCVEAMRELRIMDMRRGKDKGVLKRIFRR